MNGKKASVILLSLLVSFVASITFADTVIEGIIETSVWTPEGNPYLIVNTAEVPENNVLVIKPGVVVITNPGYPIDIYGELYCEGTQYDSILFTGASQSNRWDGIRVLNGGQAFLNYTTVEYAGTVRPEEMHGGGISVICASVTLNHCLIRHNDSGMDGGGMYIRNSIYDIKHSTFDNNTCYRVGAAIDFAASVPGDTPELSGVTEYNVFYNNYGGTGAIYIAYGLSIALDHCTFYNNVASQAQHAGDIYICGTGTLTNSIFWRDSEHYDNSIDMDGVALIASYCCSDDPIMGNDNILYTNPLFVDPSNYDLHLTEDSPCIDAGNPNYPYDEDGSITDLGAYTGDSTVPPPPPPGDEDTVSIPEIAVLPGETYTIPVVCGPLTDENIISFQGKILFPDEILESINNVYFAEGGFFENNWLLEYSINQDTLIFSLAGSEAFSGSEPLFLIEFTISDDIQAGFYELVFHELIANEDIILETESGGIAVTDFEPGDVSMNNMLQAYDAGLILTHLDTSAPLEQIQLQLAEVSGDGNLTGYDASLILQKVAGVIDLFPIESTVIINEEGNLQVPQNVYNDNTFFSIPFTADYIDDVSSIIVDIEYDRSHISLPVITNSFEELYFTVEPMNYGARIHIVFDAPLSISDEELFHLTFDTETEHDEVIHFNFIKFNDYTFDDSINDVQVHWSSSVNEIFVPEEYGLIGTFPNPFNATTSIKFNLPLSEYVTIKVMNILGQTVDILIDNKFVEKGKHVISWNAETFPTGNYFISYKSGNTTHVSKITLLK